MNKKIAIEVVKYVSALAIGVAVGAATRPAVKKLFKLEKVEKHDTIPSEDIEEAEITEDEDFCEE